MHSLFFHNANSVNLTSSLLFPNNHKLCSKPHFQSSIKINTPIPKHVPNKKVIILWDLDNKPPRGPPYDAALSLKTLVERFGDVVSISAYTNDTPSSISLNGIPTKTLTLIRFPVVSAVTNGNAADLWLEREMMSGEVGWLVMVSDDREFAEMLRKVREVNLKTVVVGDYWDRNLGKNADLWLPWNVVENGKLEGMGLMGRTEGSDDEVEGDQDLDYGEYVTEEELYERF
ncbi:hypothetical protein KIW84_072626 [Lathyrus oleraceus]|uniref:NYN domain-containing protein n=1 Tax=Pisum sativum TaxID=3888 RepID=A0A9D4VNX9_PEA|nr:hypothetical protein KIW84_072626 [Pisum sativum]